VIHCFKIGLYNLVLDVGSGSLHQVDDATLAVLQKMQNPNNIPTDDVSIRGEISSLIESGHLFSEFFSDNSQDADEHMKNRRPVVKALCLHMAHECNLRCGYCFAGDGSYSADISDRGLMSFEVGKKALDFLIENSGKRRNLEVDFFGGEPMLNFDVVKELVAYGRSREEQTGKKFRFTLTTNGSLLNDDANQYINENFDNVVISLDGRPSVNDNMRKFHSGGGTYESILPKILKLAESRWHEKYYVRGTYTGFNTDFGADVLHLADCGFKQISIEPVVGSADADYALRKQDLPILYKEYEKLADELLKLEDVHFFHFEMNMDGGPCLAKRVTGCGAGSEYLAVTPSGQLYPCHQFVTDEKFRLGDLSTEVLNTDLIAEFSGCTVFTKPDCQKCWAKYYCSGGCIATAHHTHGSIFKPDEISCELQKKRIECALYMYARKS